jgi:DNA polymerase
VEGSKEKKVLTTTTSNTAEQKKAQFPKAPKIQLREGDAGTQMASLDETIHTSDLCLAQLKEPEKVVLGAGSTTADILFCGEAPNVDEALTGEPFIGKAGNLLSKIITAMGLTRESTYLTHIMKWRPSHNKPYGERPATGEEIAYCMPYLKAQIDIIKPKVIVALGNAAAKGLIGDELGQNFSDARGTWSSFQGIPVIITFHPSYLLRNDTLKTKRLAWEDMLQVMEKCGLNISEKQRAFFLSKV